LCAFAGYVGDAIPWSIKENDAEVASGTQSLKIRNNVLANSAGDLNDLVRYGTAEAYTPVGGNSVGVPVTDIINEPEFYGGFKVAVKVRSCNIANGGAFRTLY